MSGLSTIILEQPHLPTDPLLKYAITYFFFSIYYPLVILQLDLTVILSTDPSGPDYPAGVWISLTCQTYGGSGTYAYRWRVYCSSTGALISESEPGTSNTFRVKSTPPVCSDKIECVVEDGETLSAASTTLTISPVVGKMWFIM